MLRCSQPTVTFRRRDAKRFRTSVPDGTPTGSYDLRVVTPAGITAPRTFVIGNRPEHQEVELNDRLSAAQSVALNVVVNGQIQNGGDLDHYEFSAKEGQRVVIECRAERVDSPLLAVLELYDTVGRRVAVNRGFFGIDPLIAFPVPKDGTYRIRLFDLVYSDSAATSIG